MNRPLLFLAAAIVCAGWAVLMLGPFKEWPGDATQLIAAALLLYFLSRVPGAGYRVEWRDRGDRGSVNVSGLWGREPVAIVAALDAIIAVAVGFGLPVTTGQVGLINAAVIAVLALVARSKVTPVAPAPAPPV